MRSQAGRRIGLLGQGALFEAVQRALELAGAAEGESARCDAGEEPYELLPLEGSDRERAMPSCALVVYCDDRWRPGRQREVNALAYQHGVPWLCACIEFGTAVVGPLVSPPTPGCTSCVMARRRAVAESAAHLTLLGQYVDDSSAGRPYAPPAPCAVGCAALAELVAREVQRFLCQPERLATQGAQLHLDLATLRVSRHPFLPDPECPECGHRPDDSPEAAAIALRSRPKPDPYTFRLSALTECADELLATYVDAKLGLVPALEIRPGDMSYLVSASVGVDHAGRWQRKVPGYGRTVSVRHSEVAAIAEALERYGGQRPKGKRTVVHASFRQVRAQAVDPMTLGLHVPELYGRPDARFTRYHEDLELCWVWGYSFACRQPILVPEHYAYYGMHWQRSDENPAIAYEVSNGCALGSCLEEAILYGLLEVIERDAFLLTWYARLSVPELDPRSTRAPAVRLFVERLEQVTGYTLHVYDMTLDHAVPAVMAVAVDERDQESRPKAFCDAGAHPVAEQALLGALLELATGFTWQVQRFQAGEGREHAREMYEDAEAVKEMEDHRLLYFLPEAFERLAFLTQTPRHATFAEAFGARDACPPALDLRDDLTRLIEHYLGLGLDVIVVDQTSAEHRAGGFHCVKVIVPGMLPMTFGHQHRRCHGFKRLLELPCTLGYRAQPLTEAEINPYPHPFP